MIYAWREPELCIMRGRTGSDQRGGRKEREEKEMAEQRGRCGNVRRDESADLEREGGREGGKEGWGEEAGVPLPKRHSILRPVLKDVTYFSSLCWLF